MTFTLKKLILSILILLTVRTPLSAQNSDIDSYKLNQRNTNVTFEVDSTWHLIQGVATKVNGQIELPSPNDLESLKARISLLTSGLDTGNSMRDDRLREVMASEQYPTIVFEMQKYSGTCDFFSLQSGEKCSAKILGTLTILASTKDIAIPVNIENEGALLVVTGDTNVRWKDFGVEDPSILVAKLDETVKISFQVRLDLPLIDTRS